MTSALASDRAINASVLAGAALAFVAVSNLRGLLNRQYESSRRVLDDANILAAPVARALSFGHTEWAADLLWINATLYYGETLYAHLPARYAARYTETMIELDPNFRRAYLWGANAMLYRTVTSTPEDARRAGRFLELGLLRFPSDPEMHMQYGYNLAFDQATAFPRESAERAALRARAADHMRFAASSGFGPGWLSLTASSLLRGAGRDRDAVLVLCDGMLNAEGDTATLIEGRIVEMLRDRAGEDPIYQGVLELLREHRRVHPWMPLKLHLMVGTPVAPPL